jgi:hypothetical protein
LINFAEHVHRPLIFGHVRAHDYYDYFHDLVSSALLFWDDVVSSKIV